MGYRALRRGVALAVAAGLLSAGAVLADTLRADGDVVDTDIDSFVELDPVPPGTVIELEVGFELQCSSFNHVNQGQSVMLTPGVRSIPPASTGAAVSYTGTTIGPPGAGWPVDGALCDPMPAPVRAAVPASVTITAPSVPDEYLYTLNWDRTLSPAGSDAGTFSGVTAVTFSVVVIANTPPTLLLPDTVVLEGDTTGGALAAFAVSATDAEDDPDPTPTCSVAVGDLLPVGPTTVSCAATDGGGLRASGSFTILVEDRSAPRLHGMPSDVTVATADPDGAVIEYALPTATDIVDGDVAVSCSPAPGEVAPVGASTVTCTATDDSGNSVTARFTANVRHWTAMWTEPVGSAGGIVTNGSRTVPIKVRLFADGAEVTTGSPVLRVMRCGESASVAEAGLAWGSGNGRWNGHLDTGTLPGTGCYRVGVVVEGLEVASFRLDVAAGVQAASKPERAPKP